MGFLFRSTAWVCVPSRASVRSADSNSTINARGAHPLDPLHNITPSNLFCFFSPFIVPAKPRLSPDNGCHQPTREARIPHAHAHARTRTHAHARVSFCPPPNAHAHAPGRPSNRDAVRAISSLIRPSHTQRENRLSVSSSLHPRPPSPSIVTVTVVLRAHVSTASRQHALTRQSESAVSPVQWCWWPRLLGLARCRLRQRQCQDPA